MAKRYSKAAHAKRHKQTSHKIKNVIILIFCGAAIWFGCSLWYAARTLQTAHPAESIAGEEFRPQVGDPPYRVVIDAGHGGVDPGARGVVEEKNMTAATAAELIRLLQQDANFIPLQTRNSFDETATPAQRAARASEQSPQLLLSIHGNSAANGSTASGFECYPSVLEDVNCPAVLAEQCFVTNEADATRFGSEEGCKKAARIYYEAICEYFGTQPQSEQLAGLSLN